MSVVYSTFHHTLQIRFQSPCKFFINTTNHYPMECDWISYSTLCLVTAVIVFISRHLLRRPKFNLPPGPRQWPIIGNLHLIGSLPHRSVHELSRKYGEIMHLKFGSVDVVVGSSVEMAKVFLKTMDANFSCRPKTAAGKYTTYNYSDITWSPYGPYWRQARKICLVNLFSVKRLDSFEYIRVEERESLLKTIHQKLGEPVEIKDALAVMSWNVVSRVVMGKTYMDPSESVVSPEEFNEMMEELFLLNGVFNIGDLIPWVDFMDLQGYVKRMKRCGKKFDVFLEHVLADHDAKKKALGDKYEASDIVDTLLELSEDPNLDVKLERDGVKAFVLDMLTGGTESSTVTVEWAMAELLKKPEIFERATEELDRVIGRDRWVEEKDIPNLPYIRAILKESMRLHPVAPLLIPRRTRENCKVAGYDIPENTRILINVWTIGRDPQLWDKPNEFCPERFLGKDIDVKGTDFELLPFGAGRRMCPGYSLGLKVVESNFANLLHGFNWKLPSTMTTDDLNMEEMFRLSTTKKIPLHTIAEPRLSKEMYL